MFEGPQTIAGFILEPVVGTNGILIPPDGYLQGVREHLRPARHPAHRGRGHVRVRADRRWFAVDHWGVVPDLITMAKGLTASYLPLGAVGMRRAIADAFGDRVFYGGLTYNSHPMGCAAALATIAVYEEDGLIERAARMGEVMRRPPPATCRRSTPAWARAATSACSASSSSSATARPTSRWRPTTAPATR